MKNATPQKRDRTTKLLLIVNAPLLSSVAASTVNTSSSISLLSSVIVDSVAEDVVTSIDAVSSIDSALSVGAATIISSIDLVLSVVLARVDTAVAGTPASVASTDFSVVTTAGTVGISPVFFSPTATHVPLSQKQSEKSGDVPSM